MDKVNMNGTVPVVKHTAGTRKAETFLTLNDQYDIFRYHCPEDIETTFRHRNKRCCWERLDRWYAVDDLLEEFTPVDTIALPAVSDHDAVGVRFGPAREQQNNVHVVQRMSAASCRQLANEHSKVRLTIERILQKWRLDTQYRGRSFCEVWDSCKRDIMEFNSKNEREHKARRKQQLKVARELATFGTKEQQQLLQDNPNNAELLTQQAQNKQLAEEHLRQMQLRNIEEAGLATSLRMLRDAEHSNKLFSECATLQGNNQAAYDYSQWG